ncbi:MAG TPA: choice-of-anchor tandem repeat GloVer-containing protein, partial [Terriglobales bacterium]
MNFHHFIKNAIRIFACIFVCVYVFSALACASVEERVLHSFGTAPDGSGPVSPLVMDVKGHLYGTTEYGGSYGKGTVFKLVPANGGWKETILH